MGVVVVAVAVLMVVLYGGRFMQMLRPEQVVVCDVPEHITHSTMTVVFPGANAGALTGRDVFEYVEQRYGHIVVCDYGHTWFDGDKVADAITKQLLPLKDRDVTLVMLGCSKGMLTMLDVFARLRADGFDTERIHIGAIDGAIGTENTILVPEHWVSRAWLLRWIPVGRVLSVFPGRVIMRRLGSPEYRLSHLVGHIRHVLARASQVPDMFAGVPKLVYLIGGAKHNSVLRQPCEVGRVRHLVPGFVPIFVADGGHCDFEANPTVWIEAITLMFDEFGIEPAPLYSAGTSVA